MSIREKIKDILSLSGCSQLFLLKHREIDDAIKDRDDVTSRIVSAIKDELMRVMPKRCRQVDGYSKYYAQAFNACRSQMISAITKLCEEDV